MTLKSVDSMIWFLNEDELYKTVKPYTLAFKPLDASIPRDNIKKTGLSITISDIRSSQEPFSLNHNGFTLLKFPEPHEDIDWEDKVTVRDRHYPRVIAQVERALPGARCRALGHEVRIRDPLFPTSTGKDYKFGQPLRFAHVDMVKSTAEQWIQEHFPDEAPEIFTGRYLVANVWHPLEGPNDDWPLALCDLSTVDPDTDLEIADYVTPRNNREHCMLHARDQHRWWYLGQQETTEALFFRQYDSEKGVKSGVPHASFFNEYLGEIRPRHSIETIVVVAFPQS